MTNTLFAGSDQPLQFNHDVKRFGNSAGVKAMDRFDDLEQRLAAVELLFQNQSAENLELSTTINRLRERVERQDKEIEALRHDTELLYHNRSNAIQMRYVVLDGESRPKMTTPRDEHDWRNALAHGGNILADIHAIRGMLASDCERAAVWQETFQKLYHLNFRTHQMHILKASMYLLRTCNMMATLRMVSPWKEDSIDSHDRNTYIGLCRGLVTGWTNAIEHGTADGFWDVPLNRNTFDRIERWYNAVPLKHS